MATADIRQALKQTGAEVETVLDHLLPVVDGPERRVVEAMRYSVLEGGKRFRAFLVYESARLFAMDMERALRVAAAVECVHAYSLVHDDLPCMDADDMRRGKPATHSRFGEATAILAGDALLTCAFEILGDDRTHDDHRVRSVLVVALARALGVRGMIGGQMIDLECEGKDPGIGTLTRLHQLKTGALIEYCCEAGAVLGHASVQARQALHAYAHDLGLAYQITDDLLDGTADSARLGKTAGKDSIQKKATFVTILGRARAKDQAGLLAGQAVRHLDMFDDKADLLRAAADFVVERSA